jgi:hypothetical protein
MKEMIANDICKCSSRDVLTTYQSVWLLEPYYDNQRLSFLFDIIEEETQDIRSSSAASLTTKAYPES